MHACWQTYQRWLNAGWLERIIVDGLIIAGFFAGRALWWRLWYEVQGPLTIDSTLYMSVGRGILNGLLPYRDLFESKPPGMFLVSALSLWLTDDHTVAAWLQATVLGIVPMCAAVTAWKLSPPGQRTERVLVATVAGTMLAVYSGEHAGEFQTESFGSAFAIVFLSCVALRKHEISPRWLLWATLGLAAAIGFKEPFLWSSIAGVLILEAGRPGRMAASLLLPLSLSILVGSFVMALWGILDAYIGIYIPTLRDYVGGTWAPWQRGFNLDQPWQSLSYYSRPFGLLFGIFGTLAAWFSLWKRPSRTVAVSAVMCIMALYLLALSIATGGQYYNHHHVFAVPGYYAVLLVCLRHWSRLPRLGRLGIVIIMLWFGTTVFLHPFENYIRDHRLWISRVKSDAHALDTVLDGCNEDRYLFLGGIEVQPFGFTTHSPLGPSFFQFAPFLVSDRQYFRTGLLENLHQANIVMMHRQQDLNDFRSFVSTYMMQNFSWRPPACAANITFTPPFSVAYRISAFPELAKPLPVEELLRSPLSR